MIDATNAVLEKWQPKLESLDSTDSAIWTRISLGSVEICNSIEWTDWSLNPIQVIHCIECGHCPTGIQADISRLGEHVLWTMPEVNCNDGKFKIDEIDGQEGQHLLNMFEGTGPKYPEIVTILIPTQVWNIWQSTCKKLPQAANIPQTTRKQLGIAWISEAPKKMGLRSMEGAIDCIESQLLASSTMDTPDAVIVLTSLLDWISSDPQAPVIGQLRKPVELNAELEECYFDIPGNDMWHPFARLGDKYTFMFGDDTILYPSPLK